MASKEDIRAISDRLVEIGVKPSKKSHKEFGYPNLALCVVDAVFAQRGRLGTAQGSVRGLQAYWAVKAWKPSASARKLTLSDFVARLGKTTDKQLAEKVFGDTRFTTSIKDLPLARVAIELARNLAAQSIETKADLLDAEKSAGLAAAVKATRGFGPAGAVYLRSLAAASPGSDSATWLVAFASETLERDVDLNETRELLTSALKRLRKKQHGLTAVDIEQRIWQHAAGFAKKPAGA